MKEPAVQDTSKIDQLKAGIHQLIAQYQEAHELLNEQMDAVINNDIRSLHALLEKQVAMYDMLKESELQFRTQLQAFRKKATSTDPLTLGNVIENVDDSSQTLDRLRKRLRTDVEKTEKLRKQLAVLLQFAQQQNAEIFKAICQAAEDNTEAYNAAGKKQAQRTNGIAINQQA